MDNNYFNINKQELENKSKNILEKYPMKKLKTRQVSIRKIKL